MVHARQRGPPRLPEGPLARAAGNLSGTGPPVNRYLPTAISAGDCRFVNFPVISPKNTPFYPLPHSRNKQFKGHHVPDTGKDWLFDLLVELCDHTHDSGLDEVSHRLEEALDALIVHRGGPDVVPFRTARESRPGLEFPHQMRVKAGG